MIRLWIMLLMATLIVLVMSVLAPSLGDSIWALNRQMLGFSGTATGLEDAAVVAVMVLEAVAVATLFLIIGLLAIVYRMRMLMAAVVLVTTTSSIFMAIYMHTILYGSLHVQWFTIPAYSPAQIGFYTGIYAIAMPAVIYLGLQAIPLAARPHANIFWGFLDFALSMGPIAEVGYALISYTFGNYEPTHFQFGALLVWAPVEFIELVFVLISMRLLLREFGVVGTS